MASMDPASLIPSSSSTLPSGALPAIPSAVRVDNSHSSSTLSSEALPVSKALSALVASTETSEAMRAIPTRNIYSSRNLRGRLFPSSAEDFAMIREVSENHAALVERVLNTSTPRPDLLHELQLSQINHLLYQILLQQVQIARQPLMYSSGGNPPGFNLPPLPPPHFNQEIIRGLEPQMRILLQNRSLTCWKVVRIALVVLAVLAAAFLLTTGIGYLAMGAFAWALISIGVSSKAVAVTYVIAGTVLGTYSGSKLICG